MEKSRKNTGTWRQRGENGIKVQQEGRSRDHQGVTQCKSRKLNSFNPELKVNSYSATKVLCTVFCTGAAAALLNVQRDYTIFEVLDCPFNLAGRLFARVYAANIANSVVNSLF